MLTCLTKWIVHLIDFHILVFRRDHPSTVKRRFLSVLLVALVSPLFVLSFSCSRYGNEVCHFLIIEVDSFINTLLKLYTWKHFLVSVQPVGVTWPTNSWLADGLYRTINAHDDSVPWSSCHSETEWDVDALFR